MQTQFNIKFDNLIVLILLFRALDFCFVDGTLCQGSWYFLYLSTSKSKKMIPKSFQLLNYIQRKKKEGNNTKFKLVTLNNLSNQKSSFFCKPNHTPFFSFLSFFYRQNDAKFTQPDILKDTNFKHSMDVTSPLPSSTSHQAEQQQLETNDEVKKLSALSHLDQQQQNQSEQPATIPQVIDELASSTQMMKRTAALNLKCPAFSKLVSNSSSLDEGVESDLSSPISSTFSFASGTSSINNNMGQLHQLHRHHYPHQRYHHPNIHLQNARISNPHQFVSSSSSSSSHTAAVNIVQGLSNPTHYATVDMCSSSLSSCLTSFESSHCCPSPVSIFMKSSIDDSSSVNNNAFIQHSTSCAAAASLSPIISGSGKKHSLPATLALNRKYKFSALKKNFFHRYNKNHTQNQQPTNNLSQLNRELNSLIKNSTPHESSTNLNEDQQTPTPSPAVTSTTSPTSSENGFHQKYRQFMFFKNYSSHKKKNDSADVVVGTISKQQPIQLFHSSQQTMSSNTNKSSKRNLLRQKSTSLHSLVDEKINSVVIIGGAGASGKTAATTSNTSSSNVSKVKSTAGNLTKNLNSKFKFYRKYSLKN